MRLWRPPCPVIKAFTLVGHVHTSPAGSQLLPPAGPRPSPLREPIAISLGCPQIIVTQGRTSRLKDLKINVGYVLPIEFPHAPRQPGGELYLDSALILKSIENTLIRSFVESHTFCTHQVSSIKRREMGNGTSRPSS